MLLVPTPAGHGRPDGAAGERAQRPHRGHGGRLRPGRRRRPPARPGQVLLPWQASASPAGPTSRCTTSKHTKRPPPPSPPARRYRMLNDEPDHGLLPHGLGGHVPGLDHPSLTYGHLVGPSAHEDHGFGAAAAAAGAATAAAGASDPFGVSAGGGDHGGSSVPAAAGPSGVDGGGAAAGASSSGAGAGGAAGQGARAGAAQQVRAIIACRGFAVPQPADHDHALRLVTLLPGGRACALWAQVRVQQPIAFSVSDPVKRDAAGLFGLKGVRALDWRPFGHLGGGRAQLPGVSDVSQRRGTEEVCLSHAPPARAAAGHASAQRSGRRSCGGLQTAAARWCTRREAWRAAWHCREAWCLRRLRHPTRALACVRAASGHVTYLVTSQLLVRLEGYTRGPKFSVRRRFRDFVALADLLKVTWARGKGRGRKGTWGEGREGRACCRAGRPAQGELGVREGGREARKGRLGRRGSAWGQGRWTGADRLG